MKPRRIEKLQRVTRGRRMTAEEAALSRQSRVEAERESAAIVAKYRARQAATALLAEAKSAREARHLTLQEVADFIGMDVSNVAKLENGQRENPTLDTLFRLAAALGKRVELKLVDQD